MKPPSVIPPSQVVLREDGRFEHIQDRKYLAAAIKGFDAQDQLHFGSEDLLIFIDDTGQDKLSPGHDLFGLGGLAVSGRTYKKKVVSQWINLRNSLFGRGRPGRFHATDHLHGLSERGRLELRTFLAKLPVKRFAAKVSILTQNGGDVAPDHLGTVLSRIDHQVSVMVPVYYRKAHWIFEHSNASRRIYTHLKKPHHILAGLNHIYFLKKDRRDPGLQLADLFIFVAGRCMRDRIDGKPVELADLHQAIFGDPLKGMDESVALDTGTIILPRVAPPT